MVLIATFNNISIYNRYVCIHILIRYVELKYTETIGCSLLFVSVSFILFYICVINKGQTRATDGFDTFDFQFVSDLNYFRLCCFQFPRRINFMLLSKNFNVITKGKIILSVTNKRQR